MFERLFDRPATLTRQRAGPLLEQRLRYLSHLAEQGVARHGLQVRAYYLLVVAQCLRPAERSGELVSRGEIERQAHLWAPQPGPRKLIGSKHPRLAFLRNSSHRPPHPTGRGT
jgi:hypothetical protein